MPKRTFVYGASILLGANLINRILGFIYQYLIMTHIGGEAYGLFTMVFPIYMMALVLTTAGIPLAVSKMVSEEISLGHYHQAKTIFHISLIILIISGITVSIGLYTLAPRLIDRIFPDPRVLNVFRVCTPAIIVVSIASAFRGYFQGMQNMAPTAVSQICEQIVRVFVGFSVAASFLAKGVEWAAVGLALGMFAGESVGLIVIVIQYFFTKKAIPAEGRLSMQPVQTLIKIWHLAIPVTLGRLLATGLSSLEAVLIPLRLQAAGYSAGQAVTLFGQLGGSAFTLLTFPSVFTFALSTSLVPAIAEATAQQHYQVVRSRSFEAIRLTILLGIPCLIVLFYFAYPLTAFFKSSKIAPVLRILAIGGIFTYLQQTTTGILQGLGKVQLPVINSIIAAFFRIPVMYILTGLPQWNIAGSAWSYVLGYVVMAVLNLAAIMHHTGLPLDLRHFIVQPICAGFLMLITFHLLSLFIIENVFCFLAVLGIGFLVYASTLKINGALTMTDLRKLPWIGKFIPF
ncbi:MAG: stage V sporulation protein B [Desulfitobacteriaceae bacterium]|nr:stage V sporulation protein B [Desulfitobacteriaceae bacterium]MDD4346993.1 stage V sporulation protein B [Desulfitobacteriaceae bacterium]MDD4401722.1 stage V sporulation protein B [Desulfitobacteriaceae bacterium]